MTLEDWLKQHFKTDDVKSALKQIGHIKYDLPINEELTKTVFVDKSCISDFLHWHVKYIDMSPRRIRMRVMLTSILVSSCTFRRTN